MRDAVRLVDRNQADADALQRADHALGHQALGGHVEDAHLAGGHTLPDGDIVLAAGGGVDGLRCNAGKFECCDLILHQRDQRRDHDRQPALAQCRDLIGQRLAGARGHDRKHMAPIEQAVDDPFLAGAEAVEPEDFLEDGMFGGHRYSTAGPALHFESGWVPPRCKRVGQARQCVAGNRKWTSRMRQSCRCLQSRIGVMSALRIALKGLTS